MVELVATEPQILIRQGVDARAVEAIDCFRDVHGYVLTEEASGRDLLMSEPVLERYLRSTIAFGRAEHFHVVYVDGRNHFIDGRTHWTGTVNSVGYHVREIVFTAIACGASGLILAHNHPSGRLEASEQDVEITRRIGDAIKELELALLDHWILTREGRLSLRRLGLL